MTTTEFDTSKFPMTIAGSSQEYLVQLTEAGVPWCSVKATGTACTGWKFSKADPKTCKHVKAAVARLNSSAPAATRKAPAKRTPKAKAKPTPKAKAKPVVVDPIEAAPVTETLTLIPKPMKLESTTFRDAEALMLSDAWVAEQKVDGIRCTVTVPTSGPVLFGSGSGGALKSSVARQWFGTIDAALPRAEVEYVLDGELMWDGDYHVFDVLRAGDVDYTVHTLDVRRQILVALFDTLRLAAPVYLLPQAVTVAEKARLLRQVEGQGGEGIVLKLLSGTYHEGERAKHQLKLKFRKTVDAIVTGRNVGRDSNAVLAVYDEDGSLRQIGHCSMIGKGDAQVGAVVEVAYLYATESLTIYQPSLVRERPDKAPAECRIGQLVPVNKAVLKTLTSGLASSEVED